MTPPKARKAAQAAPVAAPDPLADLREPETDASRYPMETDATRETAEPGDDTLETMVFEALGAASACWETLDGAGEFQSEAAEAIGHDLVSAIRGMVTLVTEDDQQAQVDRMIVAWHDNTIALGFLHKGGRCGCHYLAKIAAQAIAPTLLDAEPEAVPAEVG